MTTTWRPRTRKDEILRAKRRPQPSSDKWTRVFVNTMVLAPPQSGEDVILNAEEATTSLVVREAALEARVQQEAAAALETREAALEARV